MTHSPATELLQTNLPDKDVLIENLSMAFAAILVNLRENYSAQQLLITTGGLILIKQDLDEILAKVCFSDAD